jgi:predicted Zn-dependent protease
MAHAILAEIHLVYDWDWAATDRELALALELEPNNIWSIGVAGDVASVFGRWDEALRYTNETIAISPLEPTNWTALAGLLVRAGRLDQAETAYRKALEISPTFAAAHSGLGMLYLSRGQLEVARVEFAGVDDFAGLAAVYYALGKRAESDQILARASAELGETKSSAIAGVHAFRGESDAAFDWLERAYQQKDLDLVFIRGDVLLKLLEHDPRYDEFLRKMNLTR